MVKLAPKKPSPLTPLPQDRYLEPGTRTFATFFPELQWRWETRTLDTNKARQFSRRGLRFVVGTAMSRYGLHDRSLMDDLVQDLELRVATMDAASRYDPAKGAPLTFLQGIANTTVWERCFRRKPSCKEFSVRIDDLVFDGDQLQRKVREELEAELARSLERLSPGELRALIDHFGPLMGHSCPIGRRRRCLDPEALPRAVETLQRLLAHQTRQ